MTLGRIIEIVVLLVLIAITTHYYIKARKEAYLAAKAEDDKKKEEVKIILTVKIDGMMCQKCAERVTEGLKKFGEVTVNLEDKTATVVSNELLDDSEVEEAVTELGYKFAGIATE